MILADTSVWIDHFRSTDPQMTTLLRRGLVVTHEFILGELWMGNFRHRDDKLMSLSLMVQCDAASTQEVMTLVESHSLHGRGIGWIDAHLVAACRLTEGLRLWTRDRRLASVGTELGVIADLD